MSLNKNKIMGYVALIMAILGSALILIGVLKYPEYAIQRQKVNSQTQKWIKNNI